MTLLGWPIFKLNKKVCLSTCLHNVICEEKIQKLFFFHLEYGLHFDYAIVNNLVNNTRVLIEALLTEITAMIVFEKFSRNLKKRGRNITSKLAQ